jgi:hypothetical protein
MRMAIATSSDHEELRANDMVPGLLANDDVGLDFDWGESLGASA